MSNLRDKFTALAHAYEQDNDDLELIESSGDRIAGYQRHVAWMDRNAAIWMTRMEPPEFRTYFAEQDRSRRNLHELAIQATARLDRLAEQAGLPLLYGGDTTDRYAVARFAGEFTAACYEHGRSRPGAPQGLLTLHPTTPTPPKSPKPPELALLHPGTPEATTSQEGPEL